MNLGHTGLHRRVNFRCKRWVTFACKSTPEYVTIRSTQERRLIAERNVEVQQRTMDLVELLGREASELAQIRYSEGVEDFLTVLDAQRQFLINEDQLVSSKIIRAQSLLNLYRALGGGWI